MKPVVQDYLSVQPQPHSFRVHGGLGNNLP